MSVDDNPAGDLAPFEEERQKPGYRPIPFRADAALIRELGERLVGAPHIALAELVKNAYDADATRCVISLGPTRIIVSDNGQGMSLDEFENLWMTIGSTHKRERRRSREFGRPVTGSKGVGRLAAQFLAHKMQLFTKSADEAAAIHCLVDWDETATAGGLTDAQAYFKSERATRTEFPDDSPTGTVVVLERLNQTWTREQVRDLGRELWKLNSPFPRFGQLSTGARANAFEIEFETTLPGFDTEFDTQMKAALNNWEARIDASLERENGVGVSRVTVTFADGDTYSETFEHPGLIDQSRWQIRVFRLIGRQAGGISVNDAREYFSQFGVMLYDGGFRLPYYGLESDWLKIDRDHALRLSHSRLLPSHLNVERGLNDLPQQGRLIGVVSVNTGAEESNATPDQIEKKEYLQILVTRDRLVDNAAFETLRSAVRQSLDFYATRQRARESRRELFDRVLEPPSAAIRRVDRLLDEVVERFPFDSTVAELREEFSSLDVVIDQQRRSDDAARALLGPLAAAGMAALAMEHETRREITSARRTIGRLRQLAGDDPTSELLAPIAELESWLDRFEASRRIFSPLLEDEERNRATSYRLEGVVNEVVSSMGVLLPHVEIEVDVPRDVRLPPATFAEWHALLQNVLTNAGNAMLDVARPRIRITARTEGRRCRLHVSDIGVGIDVARQGEMFEPFGREQRVSSERAALGLGGSGLGLTIVRMIADQRGCNVRFVEPEDGWNTTFELEWTPRDDEDLGLRRLRSEPRYLAGGDSGGTAG